jgi:ATP-dependent DNA helicase RecG
VQATPIPRTLSLVSYGDMALSVINELPPGRSPIATRVLLDRASPREEVMLEEASLVRPALEQAWHSCLVAGQVKSACSHVQPVPACLCGHVVWCQVQI